MKKKEIKELTKQINALDKQFDKIDKNKKRIDTLKKYNYFLNYIISYLTSIVAVINDIPISNYIESKKKGYKVKPIVLDNTFRKLSRWWDKESPTESIPFKVRMFTVITIFIINNLEKIIDTIYFLSSDNEFIEFESKVDYTLKIVDKLTDFLDDVLDGKSINEYIVYFEDIFGYLNINPDNMLDFLARKNDIENKSEELEINLSSSLFKRNEDDINIDTLGKLSYLYCVNTNKYKKAVKYFPEYRFSNKKLSKEILESLGKSIIKSKNKDMNVMFLLYYKAIPLIKSKYKEINSNIDLKYGVIAFNYYSFLYEENNINKTVQKVS